jgi:hypothetical protein
MVSTRQIIASLAILANAVSASSYAPYKVRNNGVPAGQLKNISGSMLPIITLTFSSPKFFKC